MGISLDAWRLRIGCFAQRKIRAASSGNLPKLQKAISDELGGCILLVIMMMMSLLLFLSGDVEMNPGPPMYQPAHSVEKQPRKTEASRAQQQQGTGLRESILKGEKYIEKECWREATDVFNKLIYCVPPLEDPSLTCRLFCNRARCHLSQGFVLLAVKDVHSALNYSKPRCLQAEEIPMILKLQREIETGLNFHQFSPLDFLHEDEIKYLKESKDQTLAACLSGEPLTALLWNRTAITLGTRLCDGLDYQELLIALKLHHALFCLCHIDSIKEESQMLQEKELFLEEACKHCKEVIQIITRWKTSSINVQVYLFDAHHKLAQIMLRLKKFDQALKEVNAAIEMNQCQETLALDAIFNLKSEIEKKMKNMEAGEKPTKLQVNLRQPLPADEKAEEALASRETECLQQSIKAEDKIRETPSKAGYFKCDVCNVICNGQQQYHQHCSGSKHQQKLLQRQKELDTGSVKQKPQIFDQNKTNQTNVGTEIVGKPRVDKPNDAEGQKPIKTMVGHLKREHSTLQDPEQGMISPADAPSVPGNSIQSPEAQISTAFGAPYRAMVGCRICTEKVRNEEKFSLRVGTTSHLCTRNMLLVQNQNKPLSHWVEIRLRTSHKFFPGNYVMCGEVIANGECCHGNSCTFARSEEERNLWNLEKKDQFSISSFFERLKGLSAPEEKGPAVAVSASQLSISSILRKHGGQFKVVCRDCFQRKPPVISKKRPGRSICEDPKCHEWVMGSNVLIHQKRVRGEIETLVINPKPTRPGDFALCKKGKLCVDETCKMKLAHSVVEQDVWQYEDKTGIDRKQLQAEVTSKRQAEIQRKRMASLPETSPDSGEQTLKRTDSMSSITSCFSTDEQLRNINCPYDLSWRCRKCFEEGQVAGPNRTESKCSASRHPWSSNTKICVYNSCGRKAFEIRECPSSPNDTFKLCCGIEQKGKCSCWGGPCRFPHSLEEKEIWEWQKKNNVATQEELVMLSQRNRTTRKSSKDSSTSHVLQRGRSAIGKHVFCEICCVTCNSHTQYQKHCASDKHKANLDSTVDLDASYKHRKPPLGVYNGKFELCENPGACDLGNYCPQAHSEEELQEWKMRHDEKKRRMQINRDKKQLDYVNRLMEEYKDFGGAVLKDHLEDVDVKVNGVACPAGIVKEEFTDGRLDYEWQFDVTAKVNLKKISLLLHTGRVNFCLRSSNKDFADGEEFCTDVAKNKYSIPVLFHSHVPVGSFEQWLILDFGEKPHLQIKLLVDLAQENEMKELQSARQQIMTDEMFRNVELEPFPKCKLTSGLITEFLNRQKRLQTNPAVKVQSLTAVDEYTTHLNQHNYKHCLKRWLDSEELEMEKLLQRSMLQTTCKLLPFEDDGENVPCDCIEARAPVPPELSCDGKQGHLISNHVKKVYVMAIEPTACKAYEAVLIKGQHRQDTTVLVDQGSSIRMILSPTCSAELQLYGKPEVDLKISFQLDKENLRLMGFAVDMFGHVDQLFPDISKINPALVSVEDKPVSMSENFEEKNLQIVSHLLSKKTGYIKQPPLIVYGPFGSGKTYTLSQAMLNMISVTQQRCLICCKSDSAADIYILKYLQPYLKEREKTVSVLRVYGDQKSICNVRTDILQYCEHDDTKLTLPSESRLQKSNIIITTLKSSILLFDTSVSGKFTHILIDEAAQAIEPESLIPLLLANKDTVLCLTGDHMQVTPNVYCNAVRPWLQQTMFQRLFRLYEKEKDTKYKVVLSGNYRNCREILDFVSDVFYKTKLCSRREIPHFEGYFPLSFCMVQGKQELSQCGMSYYNIAEAEAIASETEKLLKSWPLAEQMDSDGIAILTPYYEQVKCIRSALKGKDLGHHSKKVVVDVIENAQGTEYWAILLSTVCTKQKLISDKKQKGHHLGVLSDPKLLNTVFTRARSLVMVIGDPLALCSIGLCQSVWKRYLDISAQHEGVKPANVNLRWIEKSLEQFHSYIMSENEMQDTMIMRPGSPSFSDTVLSSVSKDSGISSGYSQYSGSEVSLCSTQTKSSRSNSSCPVGRDGYAESDIENPDTDAIMKALQKDVEYDQKNSKIPLKSRSTLDIEYGDISVKAASNTIYDRKHIDIWLQNRNLDIDTYSEESDCSGDMCLDYFDYFSSRGLKPYYECLEPYLLRNKLEEYPDRYKRCIFQIDTSQEATCVPVQRDASVDKIKIYGRERCGQAYSGEEVVVEIFDLPIDPVDPSTGEIVKRGKVLGVLAHLPLPKEYKLICSVDDYNCSLMKPICKTLPKIVIYNKHGGENSVSVYRVKEGRDNEAKMDLVYTDIIIPQSKHNKLFIVRYLTWKDHCRYPLGVVVDVKPAANSLENGLELLKIQYRLTHQFTAQSRKLLHRIYGNNYKIPSNEIDSRKDLRSIYTFTIDPLNAKDFDDALSCVATNEENEFQVMVHIADVAYYVEAEDAIDKEAIVRSVTFYPNCEDHKPYHMLPPRLSEDLCSLRSGEDKLTISVIFTINKDGTFTKEPSIVESVIFCDKNLNYNEVEKIIEDQTTTKEFCPVKMLYQLSHARRIKRLGTGAFFLYDADHLQDSSNFKSHQLVEEWMIEANKHVAEVLLKAYPDSTILVQHLPPREELYTIWKDNFKRFLPNMLYFDPNRFQLPCLGNVPQHVIPNVEIKEDIWKAIKNAVNCKDWKTAFSLVCQEQKHPQHAHVLQQWFSIQMHRRVTCSAYVKPGEIVHSGMNTGPYTQFTSPVRRYIDLIVHRLLKAHLGNMASPYNSEDVQEICHLYNLAVLKQKHFSKDCDCLAYAFKLSSGPVRPHYTIVEAMEEDHILFRNPDYNFVPKRCETIKYASLSLQEKPELPEDNKTRTVLAWGKRIYDQMPNKSQALSVSQTELNTKRNVRQIAGRDWQSLLDKFMKGDQIGSKFSLQKIVKNVKQRQVDPYLTSEAPGGGMIFDHFKQFSLSLKGGDVLKLFFTAEIERGFLRPRIQLLSLTDHFHLCVHHKENPVGCFEDMASKGSKKRYCDIAKYQQIWRPILSMESAYEAVKSDESFYINNVKITWIQDEKNNLPVYKGHFSLGKEFCKQRHIFFIKDVSGDEVEDSDCDEDEDESDSEETNDLEHFSEYLCIICPMIPTATQTDGDKEQMGERNKGEGHIWIGHGVITGVKEQGSYIHFKLHDKSCHPTEEMLQQPSVCTLEVIPKTSTDKRMEHALENLDKASTLAKGIATGNLSDIEKTISDKTREDIKVPTEFIEDSQKKLERYIAKMNSSQKEAVTEALNSPFSLIQGPPGTGKTWTALNMLYILNEWNKQGVKDADPDTSPKILVCGPSNKSLDHLASMMMDHFNQKDKENICPNFVRVYSDTIVSQDFPVPTQPVQRRTWKKMSTNGDEEDDTEIDVHCIPQSLHYLIRERSNRYSKKILQFDEMFKTEPLLVTHEDVTKYKRTVAKAEQEALQQAEVILCTCSVSGSQKLTGLNFRQLMIDEAAMCMEPETMVPIVASNAFQVILLGDHRQLRPVVPLKAASDLGLALSLFERYSYKAMMLKTQYRMHETICQFPSEMFYGGKLETDSSLKGKSPELEIWSGRDEPQAIVFCCTEGKETTLPVATCEGSEKSKSNEDEMKHVVRMYKNLVTKHNIEPSNIVVLSQYKAQVYAIKKELEKIIQYPNVSTVVGAQGGEWDYVLLSTVRSLPDYDILERPTLGWRKKNLGFIIDSNQVNVALTRAKKGLIIVGNDNLLKVDKVWKSLLEYYQEKGCVVNAEDFLPEEIEMPLIERPKRKTPKDQYEMFADRKKFIADLPPRFRNHEMFRDHVKPKMNLNEENYTDTEVDSLSTSTGNINSSLSSQSRGTSTPGTPPYFDYESNIAGELYFCQCLVDEQGGILTLAGTGVSLYVPPRALESQTMITLGITRREQDKLPVSPDQAQTSPVVFCEPHGLVFQKMIFLTISHCIPDVHGPNTQKTIWSSETGFDECCEWKPLKDNCFSMFLHNRCIIGLHHFTKHSTSCNKKSIEVRAYGKLYDAERRKLNLNVQCIADLPDERERLKEQMAELNFTFLDYVYITVYMCDKPCQYVCLEIDEFEDSWKLQRDKDRIQKISQEDFVHNHNPHRKFRMEPAIESYPDTIDCVIKVFQEGDEEEGHKYRISEEIVIAENIKELLKPGDALVESPNGKHPTPFNIKPHENQSMGWHETESKREHFQNVQAHRDRNGNQTVSNGHCLPHEIQNGVSQHHGQNGDTSPKLLYTVNGDLYNGGMENMPNGNHTVPNGESETYLKRPDRDVRPKEKHTGNSTHTAQAYQVAHPESFSVPVNGTRLSAFGRGHDSEMDKNILSRDDPRICMDLVRGDKIYIRHSDSQFIESKLWHCLHACFSQGRVWREICQCLRALEPPNLPADTTTLDFVFKVVLNGELQKLFKLCSYLHHKDLLEGSILAHLRKACRYRQEQEKIRWNFPELADRMNPLLLMSHLIQADMLGNEDITTGVSRYESNLILLRTILKADITNSPYATLRNALRVENLCDLAEKLEVTDMELDQFLDSDFNPPPQQPAIGPPSQPIEGVEQ